MDEGLPGLILIFVSTGTLVSAWLSMSKLLECFAIASFPASLSLKLMYTIFVFVVFPSTLILSTAPF